MSIRDQVSAQLSEAAIKGSVLSHHRNYSALYVASDGTLFWDEQADSSTELRRDDGTIDRLAIVGTGNIECNCDFCESVWSERKEAQVRAKAAENANEDSEQEEMDRAAAHLRATSYAHKDQAVADAVADCNPEEYAETLREALAALKQGFFDDEEKG